MAMFLLCNSSLHNWLISNSTSHWGLPSQSLSGTLSPLIGNLTELQSVLLQNNAILGPIPATIGKLEKLQTLDFSNNTFSGEIPISFGDLKNLNYLRLNNNSLTGPCPDSLSQIGGLALVFLYVPTPHTTVVLAEHLKECIHSWNIDIKLSSITVDNCTTNDAMIDILHQEFPYGSLMLHGRFLHMLCCAHILNLIVQDGLSAVIKIGLDRIRDSVGFWIASDKRNKKFEEVAKQLVLECTKKLLLDCKTMWNSTYDMLMVALNYKEVFVILSGRESLFKNLTLNEDWEKVEKICDLLEVFNDITLVFSASKYSTSNNYFPCICGLRIAMSNWLSFHCDYIRKMVLVMLEKYNKYWADVNGLMDVATILDPRFKLKLIRFYFEKNYDEFIVQAEIDRIEGLLHELVDDYGYKNGKNQVC
ncbi:zinc finger BED domain-containing protein RICESLEEPER 2-like [Hibiscus syriacus]|uniref:zinc finger BED domain-containing protein RICESLEEPER 2-like n=1 Tax=Hibiscus syriacus TaxID=106335 RepID=UPI0019245C4B|nr:zinc finger BED domain-containing protein RICESLEEPER 2-like [Hibiscus syriacus]